MFCKTYFIFVKSVSYFNNIYADYGAAFFLKNSEDILIKKQTTASDGSTITEETVYVGDNVTADNNISHDYLRTDTQLRSADFENEVSLSHDTSTVQTTMTFTNAPDSGVKITVDRGTDKYLVFRNKGI